MAATFDVRVAEQTLNEVVRVYPAAMPVLQDFGLDLCCGGGLTLQEAVSRHQLPLQQVLDALGKAVKESD